MKFHILINWCKLAPMEHQQLIAIIRQRLREIGKTPAEVSRKSTGQKDALKRVFDGHIPSYQRLADICTALGLEFYVGPPRFAEGLADDVVHASEGMSPEQLKELEASVHALSRMVVDAGGNPLPDDLLPALLGAEGVADSIAEQVASYAAANHDIARVGYLRVIAEVDFEVTATDTLAFRRDWLERHGLDSSRCMVMRMTDDSMEPLLPKGSVVLVNRAGRRKRNGHIFVLRTEHGSAIARLDKGDDGAWLVSGDHAGAQARPWTRGDEILGEVVWMARTIP